MVAVTRPDRWLVEEKTSTPRFSRKARVLVDFIFLETQGRSSWLRKRLATGVPPGLQLEFSEASEIYRSDVVFSWRQSAAIAPSHHHRDEFQPVIPQRVALQQSPPPLHRSSIFCSNPNRLDKAVIVIDRMTGVKCVGLIQTRKRKQAEPQILRFLLSSVLKFFLFGAK